MTAAPTSEIIETIENRRASKSRESQTRYLWLRCFFWLVAIAIGAAQAWATRFTMNPDGVSYLDIADAYWRGDWHIAVNAYWSPLYSWVVGLVLRLVKPTSYREYPLVHLINLVLYCGTLACFEFFLSWLVRPRMKREGEAALPEWALWTLGYTFFIATSVLLIGLNLVSPDLMVAGFSYLLAGLLMRVINGDARRSTFVLLGVILAMGYFAKTVMFPIGLVALAIASYFVPKQNRRKILLSVVVAAAMVAPFIAAISRVSHHLTIGESARWNYLVFVNGVQPFYPTGAANPPHRIFAEPVTYEFADAGGTFPPWFDPSYWQTGVHAHLDLRRELGRLFVGSVVYLNLFLNPLLLLIPTLGYLSLILLAPRPSKCVRNACWPLMILALAAMACYAALLVEYRYVGPFVCLFALALFHGVNLPFSRLSDRIMAVVTIAIAATLISLSVWTVIAELRSSQPLYQNVAGALRDYGIHEGEPMALLWSEDWNNGAVEGAFAPRLLKAKVIAEVTSPREFWNADATQRSNVLKTLSEIGAKAILTRDVPPGEREKWIQLSGTDFYVHLLKQ